MSGAGVTEPDTVRSAGGGKKARQHHEHPEPEVMSTEWDVDVHGDVPRSAATLFTLTEDREWAADIRYARGTTDPGETKEGVLVEACAVRVARWGVRGWAAWWRIDGGSWKFLDAQVRGIVAAGGNQGVEGAWYTGFPLSATEVKALVVMTPLPGVPCTDEAYDRAGRPDGTLVRISRVRELIATHLAGGKEARDAEKAAVAARRAARIADRPASPTVHEAAG